MNFDKLNVLEVAVTPQAAPEGPFVLVLELTMLGADCCTIVSSQALQVCITIKASLKGADRRQLEEIALHVVTSANHSLDSFGIDLHLDSPVMTT